MKTTAVKIRRSRLHNEKGLATIEVVPLLVLFMMLVGYSLGLFGSIHTAILYSIASRTYAFETFRNRTNLVYFRETSIAGNLLHYQDKQIRMHAVQSDTDNSGRDDFIATTRPLTLGFTAPVVQTSDQDHGEKIFQMQTRNQSVGVSPLWVAVAYGICINAACGN